MSWKQIEITTTAEFADPLADLLTEYGALAVSLKDAADQPLFQLMPDETPLWQETQLLALFTCDTDVINVMQTIQNHAPHWVTRYTVNELQDQDWVRQTQRNFPPQCFAENLWVIPSWCDSQHYGGYKISIDPGLAFGTGTHPTTALCLEWLAKHPPKDLTVVDYGCGSGILALACLAMGAKHVYAIDHDPQALEATLNNAQLNPFPKERLTVLLPHEIPALNVNLVIANILSQPLIELADAIGQLAHAEGKLILSGILTAETDPVARAYASQFKVDSARVKEEWAQLTLSRR